MNQPISDHIKLLEVELEMEKAARHATERILKDKNAQIISLKKEISQSKTQPKYFDSPVMMNTIMTHLQTGILIENESGLVVSVNETFCTYLNIQKPIESLYGIDLFQDQLLNAPIFVNFHYFQLRTNEILIARKEVRNDPVELKDGTVLERDYIPLFLSDMYQGHIWYYYNSTEKTTWHTKNELQKKIYEDVFSKIPADIAVLNPAYGDLFLNPVAIKDPELRQWIIEWMIGKNTNPPLCNNYPNTVNSYQDLFNRAVHNKIGGSFEEKKTAESGEPIYTLRHLYPILDNQDEIVMLIGYNTNITDRVLAEQAIKKANQLTADLSRSKEIFLAHISHEIRTPMNGILGMSNLLNKTNLNTHQSKMNGIIQDAATNLISVVNDVLNMEKIAAGKLELEEIPFNLSEKINTIVDSFQYLADEKKIDLIFSNHLNYHQQVLGDPFRLAQILNNLIGNAMKFTEKGAVSIELSTTLDTALLMWIQIQIKDSGIGIDTSQVEQLFNPFIQANAATTRKYGGTGLGLGICKKLIDLQGGRIAVSSELGKGSIFSFRLPYKKYTSIDSPVKKSIDYTPLSGMTILLAEDLLMNQFIVTSLLEEHGAIITTVENGLAALEKIKSAKFDLILMDISMPEMDGIAATKIIRSLNDPQKAATPILAITANALKGDEHIYLAAGMNGYISKPIVESHFFETILSTISKSPQIKSPIQKYYNEQLLLSMGKGKIEFVKKMVCLFLQTIPSDMLLLAKSSSEKNWPLVEKTAHRMKSSIDGMGIASLKKTIRDIEKKAITAPTLNLSNSIASLNETLSQVIIQLKQDFPPN